LAPPGTSEIFQSVLLTILRYIPRVSVMSQVVITFIW
jgi:hypothetical protein